MAAGWLIPAVLLAVLLTLVGCVLASGAMHREDEARRREAVADLDAARTQLARTSGLLWGIADSALLDPTITSTVEREARATDRLLGLPHSHAVGAVPFAVDLAGADDAVIDHLCGNPRCVAPAHLKHVSGRDAVPGWDGRHVRVLP